MKITPVQGTGAPAGASVGPERMPADRIAAAKAIAAGQNPIRVMESDVPIDRQVERTKQTIRKIKMRTQVSPDRAIESEPVAETTQLDASTPVAESPQSANPTTSEPTAAVSEETKPLSPQFAALARQKRALQVKERELADREAKLTQPATDEYVSKADLLANPLKVFDAGVTYDQLTEAILASQSGMSPELKALQAKFDALEKGLDTKLSERDAQAEKQVLAEMSREASLLVAEGDDFALIRKHGYVPKVIDLIHKTFKKSGEVMDVSDALQLVENQLIEDTLESAREKKILDRLNPAPQSPQQPQQNKNSGMRTLTNRDGAAPSLGRRERAILAFSGQLRK